jgi:hypothetical protein
MRYISHKSDSIHNLGKSVIMDGFIIEMDTHTGRVMLMQGKDAVDDYVGKEISEEIPWKMVLNIWGRTFPKQTGLPSTLDRVSIRFIFGTTTFENFARMQS